VGGDTHTECEPTNSSCHHRSRDAAVSDEGKHDDIDEDVDNDNSVEFHVLAWMSKKYIDHDNVKETFTLLKKDGLTTTYGFKSRWMEDIGSQLSHDGENEGLINKCKGASDFVSVEETVRCIINTATSWFGEKGVSRNMKTYCAKIYKCMSCGVHTNVDRTTKIAHKKVVNVKSKSEVGKKSGKLVRGTHIASRPTRLTTNRLVRQAYYSPWTMRKVLKNAVCTESQHMSKTKRRVVRWNWFIQQQLEADGLTKETHNLKSIRDKIDLAYVTGERNLLANKYDRKVKLVDRSRRMLKAKKAKASRRQPPPSRAQAQGVSGTVSTKITVCSANVNGAGNVAALMALPENRNVTLYLLCEVKNKIVGLPRGWKCIQQLRQKGRKAGGGLAVVYDTAVVNLAICNKSSYRSDGREPEFLSVKRKRADGKFEVYTAFYNPPAAKCTDGYSALCVMLDAFSHDAKCIGVLVGGDFNANLYDNYMKQNEQLDIVPHRSVNTNASNIRRGDALWKSINKFGTLTKQVKLLNVDSADQHIMPTHFQHGKLGVRDSIAVLDYCLTLKEDMYNSVQSFEVCKGIQDHCFLHIELSLTVCSVVRPAKTVPNYNKLRRVLDIETRSERKVMFQKHVDTAIANLTSEESKQMNMAGFTKLMQDVCLRALGPKRISRNNKPTCAWWSQEMTDNVRKRRRLRRRAWRHSMSKKSDNSVSITLKEEVNTLRKEFQSLMRAAKRKYWQQLKSNFTIDGVDISKAHKLINSVIANRDSSSDQLFTLDQLTAAWKLIVSKSPPNTSEKLKATTERAAQRAEDWKRNGVASFAEITAAEVRAAKKFLKNGKAAGVDGLTNEVIKHLSENGMALLVTVLNRLLADPERELPRVWFRSLVALIPKKAIPETEIDFRPITLLSCLAKFMERVLFLRMRKQFPLSDDQAGFREKRGCPEMSTRLALLKQQARAGGVPVCLSFLDIKKAYDSCPWGCITEKMIDKGVPEYLVRYAHYWLRTHTRRIIAGDEDLDNLKWDMVVNRGVMQGSVWAPALFDGFIDDLLVSLAEQAAVEDASVGCALINGYGTVNRQFGYADDMAISRQSVAAQNRALDVCHQWAEDNGMQWAPSKSVSMYLPKPTGSGVIFNRATFRGQLPSSDKKSDVILGGVVLKRITMFRYLGINFISSNKRIYLDNAAALSKVDVMIDKMKFGWKAQGGMPLDVGSVCAFAKIYSKCLYGGEVYPVNPKSTDKVFHKAARSLLGRYDTCNGERAIKFLGWQSTKRACSLMTVGNAIRMATSPVASLRQEIKQTLSKFGPDTQKKKTLPWTRHVWDALENLDDPDLVSLFNGAISEVYDVKKADEINGDWKKWRDEDKQYYTAHPIMKASPYLAHYSYIFYDRRFNAPNSKPSLCPVCNAPGSSDTPRHLTKECSDMTVKHIMSEVQKKTHVIGRERAAALLMMGFLAEPGNGGGDIRQHDEALVKQMKEWEVSQWVDLSQFHRRLYELRSAAYHRKKNNNNVFRVATSGELQQVGETSSHSIADVGMDYRRQVAAKRKQDILDGHTP
jgi:hypothetical protein